MLADTDEHEIVQQVQELYADFVSVDCCHFSLNIPSNHLYMVPVGIKCRGVPALERSSLQHYYDLVVERISTVFLALKGRPFIRYQQTSDIAKLIAQSTAKFMCEQESGLFDFKRTDTLLLVLDRRGDPFTPLLNQWSYQAMVHELIGIEDNKVDLRNVGNFPKDQQEVVLSSEQDAFFKANMYENFGDIGINLKEMVDKFQQTANSNLSIQTIEELAGFVDNYPEFRRMHCNVSKHVTLVTEMSKIVEDRKLMLVSQTEQELACNEGKAAAFEALTNLINNDNVSDIDQLRSLMLYALRYEKEYPSGELIQLSHKLYSNTKKHKGGVMPLGYVHILVRQACVHDHTWDLFRSRDLTNIVHNMASGLKGVENVYTQHQPLLYKTMESISEGQLNDADYPVEGNHFQQGRPQDVVIFIVGGTTYAESRAVALFNSNNSGIHFILGGTTILNSERFLKDVEDAGGLMRASIHCGY
ncbi:vacuolar protein sorting-associated protein 45 homolog isoform X2 [Silene latifolia]